MSKIQKLLGSLAFSPILWGVAATFLLYAPIRSGAWNDPWIVRFLASPEAAPILTGLFLVSAATALVRAAGILSQRRLLGMPLLDAIPLGGQPLSACDALLQRLDDQPATIQDHYLIRRLREVLEYVYRKNTADTIEDEMRYLAAFDRSRMHISYALMRRFVWALAAVGVMGAAIAASDGVATANWTVACDVLGLAMVLATVLMFGVHVVEQLENGVLAAVDARVSAELVGRFQPSFNPAADPQVTIVRGIGEQVMRSTEQLVARQTELWKETFTEAQRQWSEWSAVASKQLQETLATALSATMQSHAATVAAAAEQNAVKWSEIQQALLQNAEAVTLQQRELVKQGEVLTQVIAATGQVEKLESELNRNLSTLSGAKNFEQTVLSLGAAIQLLNSKLGGIPTPETPKVELKAKRKAA